MTRSLGTTLARYADADGLAEHRDTAHFQQIGFGTIIRLPERGEVKSYRVPEDAA